MIAAIWTPAPQFANDMADVLRVFLGNVEVLVNAPVHLGAPACGKRIGDVSWPAGCLIVSVRRGEEELVPKGNTRLRAGDDITVLCDEYHSEEVYRALEEQCKSTVIPRRTHLK